MKTITPDAALLVIKQNRNNPNFVILDIRPYEEYELEHIPGAENLDYDGHGFQEKADALNKSKTYLIYCKSGVRGGYFLDKMSESGFREAYNILGGFVGWKIKKYPVDRS